MHSSVIGECPFSYARVTELTFIPIGSHRTKMRLAIVILRANRQRSTDSTSFGSLSLHGFSLGEEWIARAVQEGK